MSDEQDGIDLGDALGADDSAAIECLTLYIPSKDKDGHTINSEPWVESALNLLSAIGGGATALPPVDGAWVNPETGKLIREKVVLTYTYVDPDKFEEKLDELRVFLHRMGRETNQGEVAVEFDSRLYKIRNYDPPRK
jgi:hypothetical protein